MMVLITMWGNKRSCDMTSVGLPAQPDRCALLSVRAQDLLDVLADLKLEGRFQTDHIYDY